jgi:ankyrin repeat protein
MKKAGLAAGLLVLAFFSYAQDRYPIDDENPEVLKVLSDAGVNFEYPKFREYVEPWRELGADTPPDVYEKLLALGVPVEPEFNEYIRESPLMKAVQGKNLGLVDFLIQKGANVNREHSQRRTTVHFAAGLEDSRILERLIQAGADINKKDEFGYTPLHHAVGFRQPENIKLLISHNADINVQANDGETPLMAAVNNFMADIETLQAVLSGRPDINAVNIQGQSALIAAAANAGNPEIITILLNAGANAKLEDNTGRTALDWFDMNRRINRHPVRKALRDAM